MRESHCYSDEVVSTHIEIHGFSNAFEHAYVAVLYLQTINSDGKVTTRLVTL